MGRRAGGVQGDRARGGRRGGGPRVRPSPSAARCSRCANAATASAPSSRSSARRIAAARASSSSMQRAQRAAWSASRWSSASDEVMLDHRPRADDPHHGRRDPRDGPQRAGREGDERRRGRAGRRDRARRRVERGCDDDGETRATTAGDGASVAPPADGEQGSQAPEPPPEGDGQA